jgi:phage-related protein
MANVDELVVKINTDASSATSGIEALAGSLNKLKTATSGGLGLTSISKNTGSLSKNVSGLGLSFSMVASKIKLAFDVILKIGSAIYKLIKNVSNYMEDINLFAVAMGDYAKEASEYAERIGEIMGIDPGEWMRAQGTFMTLATGFGVVGDRAYIMSKNLTQLGYDLSSFFNDSVKESMERLQSGLAGELEPLRRIGYDLSQARLQQEAYTLGISKSVSAMTQAEKAELRYYTIMTQVTATHGDMARTLEAPANQLRILTSQINQAARAIGSIFIPMLNAVLPYVIAVAKGVRLLASSLASLVGFTLPEVDYSGVDSLASGADDASSALGSAADNAKKLKKYTMGFDELNVIDTSSGSSGGAGGVGGGSGFDFELPEYDFIGDATESRVDGIINKVKELWNGSFTAGWLENLDLEPLTTSFQNLLTPVQSLANVIGDKLYWGYTNVLLPLAEWYIEEALPTGVDALAEAFDTLGTAIDIVGDGFKDLKKDLQPIVTWIGTKLVQVVKTLGETFDSVGNTLEEKRAEISGIFSGIGSIIKSIWAIIEPIASHITDVILPDIPDLVGGVLEGVIEKLSGLVNFVSGVFTGDWKKAWSGIERYFTGQWKVITTTLSTFASWVNQIIIEPVSGFFSGLWDGIVEKVTPFVEKVEEFLSPFTDWVDENIIAPVSELFSGLWETVEGMVSPAIEGIQNVLSPITEWIDWNITTPIGEFFSTLWGDFQNGGTDAWEGVKETFSEVASFFETTFSTAWQGIVDVFSSDGEIFVDIKDGVVESFKKVVNNLISGINSVVSKPFEGINTVITKLKDFSIGELKPFSGLKKIDIPKIPTLADGGILSEGQAFIAREAGPELVGTIGRKTAVVNNDQIIEGIANGVSVANTESNSLLREQNSLLRALLAKETGVYLDGKQITNSVEKYQSERGRVLVTGGAY